MTENDIQLDALARLAVNHCSTCLPWMAGRRCVVVDDGGRSRGWTFPGR